MNLPFYIAKRLLNQKDSLSKNTKTIIRASVATIAVGIVVVIIAIASGKGLEKEIKNKLGVFTSDIRVSHLDNASIHSYKVLEPDTNQEINWLNSVEGIKEINKSAFSAALIKNNKDVNQVFFKGYSSQTNWSFVKDYLIEGELPDFSRSTKEILLSKTLANSMHYKVGDKAILTFFDENKQKVKLKAFVIKGIYHSGIEDLDKIYIFGSLSVIQKLNSWKHNEFQFWEIQTKNNNVDFISETSEDISANAQFFLKTSINKEIYPDIYAWVDTFDYNIYILLIIIGVVASINLISTILIIILERSNFVGVLKSLGMQNLSIRKIFAYYMFFIVGRGLLIGNLIGLLFCTVQYYFKLFPLPSTAYHIDYVPVFFAWKDFIYLNLIMLFLTLLFMALPLFFINKLKPIDILRFK